MALAILLCSVALIAPYETAFLQPEFNLLFCFNRLADLFFIGDIAVQFVTAQPDPSYPGNFLRRPSEIASVYLRGWFWLDVVTALPVDLICLLQEQSGGGPGIPMGLRNMKVIRLLRLTRLLRLAKVQRLVNRWQMYFSISYGLLSLAKFVTGLCVVSHWLACLWGAVGLSGGEDSWIAALKEERRGRDELYQNPFDIYCISLYWAVMTLTSIGYGDIVATNRAEYIIATACMFFMAGIWAYTIGAVCGIVATLSPHDAAFKQAMDDLNNMMHDQNMPHDLREKLRVYYFSARDVNRKRTERHLVDGLSPMLQGEVALFGNKKYLQGVWYLADLDHEAMVALSQALVMECFAPKECIHAERTLFILQSGLCWRQNRIYSSECCWGESNLLLSNPELWDQKGAGALTFVKMLELHHKVVNMLVTRYPAVKRLFRKATIIYGVTRACKRFRDAMEPLENSAKWGQSLKLLSWGQRMHIWTHILSGSFSLRSLQRVINTIDRSARSIPPRSMTSGLFNVRRDSLQSVVSEPGDLDSSEMLHSILERVQTLSVEVANISNVLGER
jgi:hypothetical protein